MKKYIFFPSILITLFLSQFSLPLNEVPCDLSNGCLSVTVNPLNLNPFVGVKNGFGQYSIVPLAIGLNDLSHLLQVEEITYFGYYSKPKLAFESVKCFDKNLPGCDCVSKYDLNSLACQCVPINCLDEIQEMKVQECSMKNEVSTREVDVKIYLDECYSYIDTVVMCSAYESFSNLLNTFHFSRNEYSFSFAGFLDRDDFNNLPNSSCNELKIHIDNSPITHTPFIDDGKIVGGSILFSPTEMYHEINHLFIAGDRNFCDCDPLISDNDAYVNCVLNLYTTNNPLSLNWLLDVQQLYELNFTDIDYGDDNDFSLPNSALYADYEDEYKKYIDDIIQYKQNLFANFLNGACNLNTIVPDSYEELYKSANLEEIIQDLSVISSCSNDCKALCELNDIFEDIDTPNPFDSIDIPISILIRDSNSNSPLSNFSRTYSQWTYRHLLLEYNVIVSSLKKLDRKEFPYSKDEYLQIEMNNWFQHLKAKLDYLLALHICVDPEKLKTKAVSNIINNDKAYYQKLIFEICKNIGIKPVKI